MMKNHKLLTLSLLASLITVTPAMAAGPLALCDNGQPFLWPNGGQNIPFNPDQGGLGPVSAADAVQLVEDAFQAWEDVATSTVTYQNAGLLPVDVDVTNFGPFFNAPAPDGLSAVVFDDDGAIFDLLFGPGSGILGFASPEFGTPATCEIDEGFAFLNGPAFTDLTAALDVTVHEFGHYLNLAHSVVNGQIFIGDTSGPTPNDSFTPIPALGSDFVETMYPFYFGPGSGSSTIERDDASSLSQLYPEANYSSSTATISGTVFDSTGSFRLTGANVIARNINDPFDDAVSAISSDFTDDFSQANALTGTYSITGLTPGAEYAVFVDGILAGGFSTPPLAPLPGPEEFHNGVNESNDGSADVPTDFVAVSAAAGGDATATDIIFNQPAPGVPLPLGDDDNVAIALPFTFSICDQDFNSVFINSNGNLTFGVGDNDFSESSTEMLGQEPRIAGLWDDLNPSAAGTVIYTFDQNRFTVTYTDVPEFFSPDGNTFSITLKRSANQVDITYGTIAATDGLAGVSCGGAITSGFEPETDLTAMSTHNFANATAIYEVFTDADNDLSNAGRIRFNNVGHGFSDVFEPNDSLADAASVSLPFSTLDDFSDINPVGADVDFYSFDAEVDTTLVAEVIAGSLDTVLGLFDAAGNQLAFDDDGGAGLLSRIIFPIPSTGTYVIAVSTFADTDFSGDGGSGGRYVLDLSVINGILLALGDDSSQEVSLAFGFPFQGQVWNSVFVNSNGNLTFGSGSTDFSESVSDLLSGPPRIAGLWDDLSPNAGGLVIAELNSNEAVITFQNVPEFFSGNSNNFSITLSDDGNVSIDYGSVDATDGLVGVSEGGGAVDPGTTDLSAGGGFSATGTTYELFDFVDNFDLENGTVSFSP